MGVIPLESNPPKPALPLLSSPCPENAPADARIKLSYCDDPEPLSLGVKIPRFTYGIGFFLVSVGKMAPENW